jgi:hypothetical protein
MYKAHDKLPPSSNQKWFTIPSDLNKMTISLQSHTKTLSELNIDD